MKYDPHIETIGEFTIWLSEDYNEWQVWWHDEILCKFDTYKEAVTAVREAVEAVDEAAEEEEARL